jgi:hypothetical protein
MMYTTKTVPGFAAVSLEGPSANLQEAQASLKVAGLTVEAVGQNSILLRDVREASMENVQTIADAHEMRVVGTFGPKDFVLREQLKQRKAFKLSIEPNKWYFADNLESTHPFVVVRDVRIERTGNNGNEDQLLDIEFYGPDHSMPVQQTVTSREAAEYGLRPATEEDFEDADMVLPVSEFSVLQIPQPSHGIPGDTPPVDETPNPSSTSQHQQHV